MDNFSQNPFFCSQPPLMGPEIFLAPLSYGVFQSFSTQGREKRIEESEETNVKRVEEKVVEGANCEIIESSPKESYS